MNGISQMRTNERLVHKIIQSVYQRYMCSHQSTVSKLLQICCHGPKLLLLEFLYLHLDKTGIEQELTLCMDHVLRSDVHDYCILL